MLLALDAGNTNITAGVFHGGRIVRRWRHSSRIGVEQLTRELKRQRRRLTLTSAVYGSVVPRLNGVLERAVSRALGLRAQEIGARSDLGLSLQVRNPAEVGADLVLNALAARELGRGAALVVDFGTATTVQGVSASGRMLGVSILPGPDTAAWALAERTALLPHVSIRRPGRVLGRDTEECLHSGLYYGYLGMIEKVVSLAERELGGRRPALFVTGGLSALFRKDLPRRARWEPNLTLHGLRLAYERMTSGGKGK